MRKETLSRALKKTTQRIIATDRSKNAVEAAMKNARTAGVEHLIEFKVCDFSETDIPEKKGMVMFNPEYGERMGDEIKLAGTYKGIGDFFKKRCSGYTGFVFTGSPVLARKVGLSPRKKTPFYNGEIECRLFEYEIF